MAMFWATDLNVTALSAAERASLYRKSISFCPGPSSWWEPSGRIPISLNVKQMSRRTFRRCTACCGISDSPRYAFSERNSPYLFL